MPARGDGCVVAGDPSDGRRRDVLRGCIVRSGLLLFGVRAPPRPGFAVGGDGRVLRPGGIGFVSAHYWTSESGAHDIRVFAGDRNQISLWTHLRPAHRHETTENAYLNYWRVEQYRQLYASVPDGRITVEFHETDRLAVLGGELQGIRAAGELDEYTDEELLGMNISVIWRKPAVTAPSRPRSPAAVATGARDP